MASGLAEKFLCWFAIDRRSVVDDSEVRHCSGTVCDGVKLGEAFLESGELGVDIFFWNGAEWDGHVDAFVIWQCHFGSEGEFRNEGDRAIRMGGDIFGHAEVEHVEGFLFESFVVGLVDEVAVEFLGDFLLEAFFHDRARGFARPIAWHAGLVGIPSYDLVTLPVDFFGWDFNAEGGYALGLLFDDNVHDK